MGIASLILLAVGTVVLSSYDLFMGFVRLLEFVFLVYTGLFWAIVIGSFLAVAEIGGLTTIPLFLLWVVMAWSYHTLYNYVKRDRFASENAWNMTVEDGKEPLSDAGLSTLRNYAKNIKADLQLT